MFRHDQLFTSYQCLCNISQYSDLAEAERALILDKFRHATMKWNKNAAVHSGSEEAGNEEQKSHMIVATDACLPLLASGESPISSSVLINYELPTKKVLFIRTEMPHAVVIFLYNAYVCSMSEL